MDHVVHCDLERQRSEQGQRRRQQTEQENAQELTPIGPCLLPQSPVEKQIAKPGHDTFPLFQFSGPR